MSNSLVYLGKTYTDSDIISGSSSHRQSLSMSELSVDTMEITLRSYLHLDFFTGDPFPMFTRDRKRFNTTESDSFAGGFQQNTPITQYIDENQVAIWYLQNVERISANIYKLSCFSSLGRLMQITHYGGVYGSNRLNPETVSDVVYEICGDDIPYEVDEEYADIEVHGWLPVASARDNLQQLLFAVNASLQTDENGKLLIKKLNVPSSPPIDYSSAFLDGASVKYGSPITKINLVVHRFWGEAEEEELFNSDVSVEKQLVVFSSPIKSLRVSEETLSIVNWGANYAVVSGIGVLYGKPYLHTQLEVSENVSEANAENIVRIDNATLIGVNESAQVLNRLKQYYSCRDEINLSVNRAFLSPGAVIDVLDPYDMVMRQSCIESAKMELSSHPKTSIETLVGFKPYKYQRFVEEHIVIPDSGIYTFPDDIIPGTGVLCVLIGGGDGGFDGQDGASVDGNHFECTVANESSERQIFFRPVPGGNKLIVPAGTQYYSDSLLTSQSGITEEPVAGDLYHEPGFFVHSIRIEIPVYDEELQVGKIETYYTEYDESYQYEKVGSLGGKPGNGGRVFQTIIAVNPSQSFEVEIGAGGSPGKQGGDTIFGSLSTAGAKREPYTDYVNGVETVYASDGIHGQNGGVGGDGSANSTGGTGQNVAQYLGGSGSPRTIDKFSFFDFLGGNGGSGATLGRNGLDALMFDDSDYPSGLPNFDFDDAFGAELPSSWKVYREDSPYSPSFRSYRYFHYETVAINGVDAPRTNEPESFLYGSGGNGGNGGSGAGGLGGMGGNAMYNWTGDGKVWRYIVDRKGAEGGKKSLGTSGVHGCVILSFMRPQSDSQ